MCPEHPLNSQVLHLSDDIVQVDTVSPNRWTNKILPLSTTTFYACTGQKGCPARSYQHTWDLPTSFCAE